MCDTLKVQCFTASGGILCFLMASCLSDFPFHILLPSSKGAPLHVHRYAGRPARAAQRVPSSAGSTGSRLTSALRFGCRFGSRHWMYTDGKHAVVSCCLHVGWQTNHSLQQTLNAVLLDSKIIGGPRPSQNQSSRRA